MVLLRHGPNHRARHTGGRRVVEEAAYCPLIWIVGTPPQVAAAMTGRRSAKARSMLWRARTAATRRGAITRVHPRQLCGAQVLFLCSISAPFLHPDRGTTCSTRI